jgi:hypothetical protein
VPDEKSSICDLQEKFRPAIHEYAKVIATTQKVLKACMFPDVKKITFHFYANDA